MKRNSMCGIFFYQRRVLAGGKPVLLKNGEAKVNDNFISFMQVISAYWDTVDLETGKRQLNVFLNGGSVIRDRTSGEMQSKAGYSVQFPEFIGERFMREWYSWSSTFGLTGGNDGEVTADVPVSERRSAERSHRRSAVNEDEFVDVAIATSEVTEE